MGSTMGLVSACGARGPNTPFVWHYFFIRIFSIQIMPRYPTYARAFARSSRRGVRRRVFTRARGFTRNRSAAAGARLWGGPTARLNAGLKTRSQVLPSLTRAIAPLTMWSQNPFPSRLTFKMPYTQPGATYSVGVAGIAGPENVFRLGSIYDPDLTGAGHSAYWLGQTSSIYRKYRVTAVEVNIVASGCTAPNAMVVAQFQSSSSTQVVAGATHYSIRERPGAVYIPLQSSLQTGAVTWNSGVKSIPAFEGISWTQFIGDEDYDAQTTGNPTLTPYLRVAMCNADGNNSGSCNVQVSFIFYGYFFDRIDQAGS